MDHVSVISTVVHAYTHVLVTLVHHHRLKHNPKINGGMAEARVKQMLQTNSRFRRNIDYATGEWRVSSRL